jgi:putative toxin-antitoxin system antitoxin component (TIGR02293 family)
MAAEIKSRGGKRTIVVRKNTAGRVMARDRYDDFRDTTKAISQIKSGLPVKLFFALREQMNVSAEALAEVVGIAPRTLLRRKQAGKLQKEESERVVRVQRLFEKALDVFEDKAAAQSWFSTPQLGLCGKTALEYADTELGAREVENLLGRIEHGVFA